MQIIDPLLRAEMVERTAEIADDPRPYLRRPFRDDELSDVLVFEYSSEVIHELWVRLLFADVDPVKQSMALVAVLTTSGEPPHER